MSKQIPDGLQSKKMTLWTGMYIRLGIATVLLSFVEQIITVNMSLYMEDLGAEPVVLGMVVTAFNIASMFSRFLTGPIMDTKGRLLIGLAGLYLTMLPVLGYIFLPVVWVVIVLRFIQGVGFSFTSLAQGTMSADIPDPEKMDEGVGYYGLFFSVATIFGPAIGLEIVERYGYNAMFIFCIAGFVLDIAIMHTLNYEKKRGIVYKKCTDPKDKFSWNHIIEKTALPAATVSIFTSAAYSFVSSFMAVYARSIGLDGTGIFFTAVALSTLVGRVFSGKMIGKKLRVKALILGNVIMAVSMVVLATIHSTEQMLIGGLIFGFGSGYAWPTLAVLSVCDTEIERRGTATSTYYALYDLGVGAGGIIGGAIAGMAGYRVLFGAGVVLFIAAAVLSFILFPAKIKEERKITHTSV